MLRPAAFSALLVLTTRAEAGTCVYPVWVDLPTSAAAQQGPDFVIPQFKSALGTVNVYQGCCSEVSDDRREVFLKKDGEKLYRTSDGKRFSGYLTIFVERIDGTDWERQAHFFGDGLHGDDRDRAFFDKVRFGRIAKDLCDATPERG